MTLYDTPSQLFTPALVTAENLKAEIIDKKHRRRPSVLLREALRRRLQEARHHADSGVEAARPPSGRADFRSTSEPKGSS